MMYSLQYTFDSGRQTSAIYFPNRSSLMGVITDNLLEKYPIVAVNRVVNLETRQIVTFKPKS